MVAIITMKAFVAAFAKRGDEQSVKRLGGISIFETILSFST